MYVMEYLDEYPVGASTPNDVARLLADKVWCKRPKKITDDWIIHLENRISSFSVPDWVSSDDDSLSTIHGDPTLSNLFIRDGDLVLSDSIRREYIPSFFEVDLGKILQSMLGWETVAYGYRPIDFDEPSWWPDYDTRRRSLFWCGVHCLRILARKPNRPDVREWCQFTIDRCFYESRI